VTTGTQIFILPCGCFAAEGEGRVARLRADGTYAECPWCGATWDADDFAVWWMEHRGSMVLRFARVAGRLFQHGASLCEVVRVCDCGNLLVRECTRGWARREVVFHFSAPDGVLILRD
jgi:hypothetical protein